MILPTLLIVLSIVLLPLLANFWISFKPVQLGDLRPPAVVANERLRPTPEAAGDVSEISYRLRNASQRGNVSAVVMRDTLPEGLKVTADLDERCVLNGSALVCQLGDYEAGHRETLKIPVVATQAFIDNPVKPRSSKPSIAGESDNILTSGVLTLENYRKIFSASEFWSVLRVSLYYTVFGTIGALLFRIVCSATVEHHVSRARCAARFFSVSLCRTGNCCRVCLGVIARCRAWRYVKRLSLIHI